MKFFNKLLKNEEGATAIEYGLIAALISVAMVGAAGTLGGKISETFTTVEGKMTPAEAAAANDG